MKKFLIKIFILFSFFIFITGILLIGFIHKYGGDNLPAMNFTDSYSYNEKILFLKKQSKKPKIISIGSSMTLCNLYSEVLIKEFHNDNYLNASSWGIRISENYILLKLLYEIFDFNKIVIVSNIVDFQKSSKSIDYNFICDYLTNNVLETIISFIKNFNLNYYLEKSKYAKYVRNCRKDYEYLKFDNYGMVKFDKDSFNINQKRWSNKHLDIQINEIEYSYLDSISNFCVKNNIDLYFFHSPHRTQLKLSAYEKKILKTHINRLENQIGNKHYFINANESFWSDTLFVDGIHLNKIGAKLFTQYCFDLAKKQTQKENY